MFHYNSDDISLRKAWLISEKKRLRLNFKVPRSSVPAPWLYRTSKKLPTECESIRKSRVSPQQAKPNVVFATARDDAVAMSRAEVESIFVPAAAPIHPVGA